MVDLKIPEKKLLSEDLWVELSDDVKIRIDYMTRSQEVQFNRLRTVMSSKRNDAETEDPGIYYLRSTIKDVVGYSRNGKPLKAVIERGFFKELTDGNSSIDLLGKFVDWDLVDAICGLIMSHLEVTDVEKKTSQSPPDSSKTESSEETGNPSSPEVSSLTDGIQSIPVVGKIS